MVSRIAEMGDCAEAIALALLWALGMLLSIAGTFFLVFLAGCLCEYVLGWLGHSPQDWYWTAVGAIAVLSCALSPVIAKIGKSAD